MTLRVLIDESLPQELMIALEGHEVQSVQHEGWSGIKNGEVLRRAGSKGYDVLLTPDRALQFQQNISRARVAVVVLRAQTNRIEDLLPLVPKVLDVLRTVKAGTVTEVRI